MKNIRQIYPVLFFGMLFILFNSCLSQKEQAEQTKLVERALRNDHFKFTAQQVIPLRMRAVQLNDNYTLEISKDTIKSFLPYYGVAFQAPYDSRNQGITFTSTNFSYQKAAKADGSYTVTIEPKDTDQASKMYLQVSSSGNATLSVNSNQRDAISFNGRIESQN